MKNRSHSPVTEMLSGKYKILLAVGLVFMFAADLTACVVLWINGVNGAYWIWPFFMTLIDGLYFAGVMFSNQRFKYAKKLFGIYIGITLALCGIWLLMAVVSNDVVYSSTAVIVWTVLHVTGMLVAVVTYFYAAKAKRGRTVQFVLSIIGTVALLGGGVYYGVSVVDNGYFGQGGGVRPLVYEYLSDSTCAVTGVIDGNGKKAVVPYEFNGKKVVSVSAVVFAAGVDVVELQCDTSTELFADYTDVGNKNAIDHRDLRLYAEKDKVDEFKKQLYDYALTINGSAVELGNSVYPVGLDKDEVCITFDYTETSYVRAEYNMIPTWYGKKGDKFDISQTHGPEYALHSDIMSDEDLYWSLQRNGYMMSELNKDGFPLSGATTIDKSVFNVPVSFAKVFKLYAGVGNDEMYDTAEHFKCSVVDGVTFDHKLAVAENADKLLEQFDRGEGFTRTMFRGEVDKRQTFTSLQTLLETSLLDTEVTITPMWQLVSPDITISTEDGKTDVVYGDRLTLKAKVTHPILSQLDLEYDWFVGNLSANMDSDTFVRDPIGYVGEREYMARVIVTAPELTSLEAGDAANIYINASKRKLTAVWSELEDDVYDGNLKTVTVELTNAVDGDDVDIYNKEQVFKDAGVHNLSVGLTGYDSDNYELTNGYHEYTVKPRPVALDWDGVTEYEYDGNQHAPTATAYDVDNNILELIYSGVQTDAGNDYTVRVDIKDTNYTVDTAASSDTAAFRIYPRTVDVNWQNTDLTYNGRSQVPTPIVYGINNVQLTVNVSGAQTDSNMAGGETVKVYTATATISDGNYVLSDDTSKCEFTIKQYAVSVIWTGTTLTYNGKEQAPVPTARGLNNVKLDITVSGGQTNAGELYNATATLVDDNYIITSGEQQRFTIRPYTVRLTWRNTSLTYNGNPQNATVSATGVGGSGVAVEITSPAQTDFGSYTATAVIGDPNYTAAESDLSRAFYINKRNITVSWSDTVLTYNGEVQGPKATLRNTVGEIDFEVLGKRKDAGDSYTAAISIQDNNYVVSQGATCDYRIEKKRLTVKIGDVTAKYGEDPDYVVISVSGVVEGDSVSPVCTVAATDERGNIPVGTHDISVTLAGVDSGNYEIDGVTSNKATLTVTAD